MKTTGTRSLILYILTGGFLLGLGVFLVSLFLHGGEWALQPYNAHLSNGQLSYAGQIEDRNGDILSKSENGKRVYSSDEAVRRATLHTVGDTRGYIASGIQYRYRADLSGYNLLTGITSPTGKNTGSNIRLALDADLCVLAQQRFNGKNGAVFVYNYRTGEVVCVTSAGSYDPANPPADLDTDESGKYEGVYLNRALSASFTPGSTFKIMTTAAAIEAFPDLDSQSFSCSGSVVINGNKINCTGTHGTQTFRDALANSCNVAFAEISVKLGAQRMTEAANAMGFNQSLAVDGYTLKKSVYTVDGASEDELAWSGIGQYTDLANPAHMAIVMGAIANGGTPVTPYLVSSITTSFGLPAKTGAVHNGSSMLKASTAARLKEYMRYNVTNHYGDGMFPGLNVCAKTGTAEVEGKKDTSWIVGFSDTADAPYAFAVVVEEGGFGVNAAGDIASAVLQQAAKTIQK